MRRRRTWHPGIQHPVAFTLCTSTTVVVVVHVRPFLFASVYQGEHETRHALQCLWCIIYVFAVYHTAGGSWLSGSCNCRWAAARIIACLLRRDYQQSRVGVAAHCCNTAASQQAIQVLLLGHSAYTGVCGFGGVHIAAGTPQQVVDSVTRLTSYALQDVSLHNPCRITGLCILSRPMHEWCMECLKSNMCMEWQTVIAEDGGLDYCGSCGPQGTGGTRAGVPGTRP